MTCYVYELPEKMSTDLCFGAGVPITFLNVDWFQIKPLLPARIIQDDLITFIGRKKYFDKLKTYLVIGDGFCFTMGGKFNASV